MVVSSRCARRCAWLTLVAQVLFVVSWLVAGAQQPGYSMFRQGVSELTARFAVHPWIVQAGFVVLAVSIVAVAISLHRVLPRSRWTQATSSLLTFVAVGLAVTAFLPLDCSPSLDAGCRQLLRAGALSRTTEVHEWLGLAISIALVMTPFTVAAATRFRPIAVLALAAGVAGLLMGVGGFFAFGHGADGLVDRWELANLHAWIALLAVSVLHSLPRVEAATEPTPLRPREFFDQQWTGDGEIVLRPLWLWRRLAVRFRFRRETRWLAEDVWLVTDRSTFPNHSVIERRMVCELAGDGVHVTAGDLPGGARFSLEDDGYRIAPYVFAAPLGPLAALVRCRDQHRITPDGTLEDTVDASCLGIPLARLTARGRPDHVDIGPVPVRGTAPALNT